ncbi:MAG: hypothetical protein HQK49_10620 [Oligoflexia bacterium]|nr:hypothetical protein [Oligoflexia bacterium]
MIKKILMLLMALNFILTLTLTLTLTVLTSEDLLASVSIASDRVLINLIVRSDYEINNSDDDTIRIAGSNGYAMNTNDELLSREFKVKAARLKLRGKLDESLNYYLDWNVNKSFSITESANSGTVHNVDLIDSIDEIWGKYKINNILYFKVGKIFSGVGGRELLQMPQDIYLYSLVGTEFSEISYRPGIIGGVKLAGQEVYVAVVSVNDGTKNKKIPAVGIVYLGDFLEGLVSPHLSFHRSQTSAQVVGGLSGNSAAAEKVNYYYSLGLGLKMWEEQLLLDLNWPTNIYTNKTAEGKNDMTQSMMAEMKFNLNALNSFVPLMKCEYSKKTLADSDYIDRIGYSFGLEYLPMNKYNKWEHELKIYSVYSSYTDEYKRDVTATTQSGAKRSGKKITTSQILVGVTLNI